MKSSAKRVGRILVVDDEEGVRTFVAEALERSGHEVMQVADGAAALRAVPDDRCTRPRLWLPAAA